MSTAATEYLALHLARLYLTWVLMAISGIGIVLLFVFLLLDLGDVTFDLYEASQDVLLILLPFTGYLYGRMRGSSDAR
jgi:uncharacterized integral membrane protein